MAKYYVVLSGWDGPAIYNSWEECRPNVEAISGAKFRRFHSLSDAEHALKHGWDDPNAHSFQVNRFHDSESVAHAVNGQPFIDDSIVVRVEAHNLYSGITQYQLYDALDELLFESQYYPMATHHTGAFLGAVHALMHLNRQNDAKTPIYVPSDAAMRWLADKSVNTNLKYSSQTAAVLTDIDKAVLWLQHNHPQNPTILYKGNDLL